jgi:type VI secretion system secreted protein VgrG
MRQPPFLPFLLALVLSRAAWSAEPVATLAGPGVGPIAIASLEGREAISSLFRFDVELAGAPVGFDALLGKEVTVSLPLPGGGTRHFSGICSRISAGKVERLEIVPKLWLLTRSGGNRVFQDLSVPQIAARVLTSAAIPFHSDLTGDFPPRAYVVQHGETDFDFVSRLLEEEGIYYFFTHGSSGGEMVLANAPEAHPAVPDGSTAQWIGASARPAHGVTDWTKTQELRSGKVTLRDHVFQFPDEPFAFSALIQESVVAGRVTHRLRPPLSEALEIYDFPGRYAQRFEGLDDPGASAIAGEGERAVEIRAAEEAAQALAVHATSDLGQLTSGHKFALVGHPDADGEYVITAVTHSARPRTGRGGGLDYTNTFTCIPAGLPFRPARLTPRPRIAGLETAIVTGPEGATTHTDAFGRVKVQFHWDREGSRDENSSCWIRVGALHAGQETGFVAVPSVGDEVVVAFLDGDPDRPIIVGSLYNPNRPPPR